MTMKEINMDKIIASTLTPYYQDNSSILINADTFETLKQN